MRKIPLQMVTPDMKLGQSVYAGPFMLLRKGTGNLQRYLNKLNELGVSSIYIDDQVGEGIEIPDIISPQTRSKCEQVLAETFAQIIRGGNPDTNSFSDLAKHLVEEVIHQPNILVSLADIGSSGEETLEHSINATIYGLILANKIEMSEVSQRDLAQGLLLHDIGKITLDQDILYKKGSLSKEEFEHIKSHPLRGYEILKTDPLLTEATRRIALEHHERLDGSGYVSGFNSNELGTLSRIASIVDVYEALTVNRCYRRSYTPSHAAEIITMEAVGKLDSELVSLFFKSVAIYPNGSFVLLSNERLAVVKEQNPGFPFCPVVRLINKKNGISKPDVDIDLLKRWDINIVEDDPEIMAAFNADENYCEKVN